MNINIGIDDLKSIADEIVHLRKQRDELQHANNEEMERRRKAEADLRQMKEELNFIDTPEQLYELHGVSDLEGFKHRIYRDTKCGAWVEVTEEFNEGELHYYVKLGSIVEGSDACPEPITLMLPTTQWHWGDAIRHIEQESEQIWREAHKLYEGNWCPACENDRLKLVGKMLQCSCEFEEKCSDPTEIGG